MLKLEKGRERAREHSELYALIAQIVAPTAPIHDKTKRTHPSILVDGQFVLLVYGMDAYFETVITVLGLRMPKLVNTAAAHKENGEPEHVVKKFAEKDRRANTGECLEVLRRFLEESSGYALANRKEVLQQGTRIIVRCRYQN